MSINKVKEMREYRGITVRQLADFCDVSAATISNIECGRNLPNILIAQRIARAFEAPIGEVFPEEMRYANRERPWLS